MKAEGVEVDCHFIFSSELSDLGEMVYFCLGLLVFDLSDGEGMIGPQDCIHFF